HVGPRPYRVATVRAFTPTRVTTSSLGGRTPSVVRASPNVRTGNSVVRGQAGGRAVVRAPAANSYRPSSSPLYRYPTATGSRSVRVAPRSDHATSPAVRGGSGVGRVVRPGTVVRPSP